MGTQSFSYYSDGFLMQVLAQRKAQVQLPLQNKGSQGFSPPFYSLPFKKKRRRTQTRRAHLPTYSKGVENQLQFLLYTASKRKSFTINSPCLCLEAAPVTFCVGPLDSNNNDKLGMVLAWASKGDWVCLPLHWIPDVSFIQTSLQWNLEYLLLSISHTFHYTIICIDNSKLTTIYFKATIKLLRLTRPLGSKQICLDHRK